MTNQKITKAIFPVAGFGTRFLPATKANPKEMLPIVDKPLIQYAVEEAISAGITELIFVTNHAKRAIEDHFDSNFELEERLRRDKKFDLLDLVQNILPKNVSCFYVRQQDQLGLGHAILCAKKLINSESFAVLLADNIIDAEKNSCMKQMVDVFTKTHSSVIAVEPVQPADVRKYGIVGFNGQLDSYAQINSIIEKPSPARAPSNFAVVGRYILPAKLFDYLENAKPGSGGEIQLTDAIARLLQDEKIYALKFKGKRFDCGSKVGYLKATVNYALKHKEIPSDFKSFLQSVLSSSLL